MGKKLNLGCRAFKKEGYVNVDCCAELKPEVLHNLDEFPYPFNDNEFDLIEADHVLEHLKDPFRFMKEIHRVAKKDALVIIKVLHFSRGFIHPCNRCGFDISFVYSFRPEIKSIYQGVEFKIENIKLQWLAQPYLKKEVFSKPVFWTAITVGKIIDFFASLSPVICSRIWCFWVGGFEEMVFRLTVKK